MPVLFVSREQAESSGVKDVERRGEGVPLIGKGEQEG